MLNFQWDDVYWDTGEYGAIALNKKEYSERISLQRYPETIKKLKENIKDKEKEDRAFSQKEIDNLQLSLFPIRSKTSLAKLKCEKILCENGFFFIERKNMETKSNLLLTIILSTKNVK